MNRICCLIILKLCLFVCFTNLMLCLVDNFIIFISVGFHNLIEVELSVPLYSATC